MLNTLKPQHVFGFILFLLFSYKAAAQSYMLDGDYFVRSSEDYLSENNKIGILHKGSTFRVVNRTNKNGGTGLEIEVTSMTQKSYVNPSPSGRVFIYKSHRNSDFIKRNSAEGGLAKCLECEDKPAITATTVFTKITDRVYEMANTAPKDISPPEPPPSSLMGPIQKGSLDEKIKNYSNSPEVARMIEWAMKNKNASSHGICYRKVKEAMATLCGPNKANYVCKNPFAPEGGKKGPGKNLISSVSTEMADSYALSAKNRLKKDGFVNLLEAEPYKSQMLSPADAPKGAILVYSSGIPCNRQPDCGHTEIKTDTGYVSDYFSKDAINETPRARKYGSNYKLVGVMIKPKD